MATLLVSAFAHRFPAENPMTTSTTSTESAGSETGENENLTSSDANKVPPSDAHTEHPLAVDAALPSQTEQQSEDQSSSSFLVEENPVSDSVLEASDEAETTTAASGITVIKRVGGQLAPQDSLDQSQIESLEADPPSVKSDPTSQADEFREGAATPAITETTTTESGFVSGATDQQLPGTTDGDSDVLRSIEVVPPETFEESPENAGDATENSAAETNTVDTLEQISESFAESVNRFVDSLADLCCKLDSEDAETISAAIARQGENEDEVVVDGDFVDETETANQTEESCEKGEETPAPDSAAAEVASTDAELNQGISHVQSGEAGDAVPLKDADGNEYFRTIPVLLPESEDEGSVSIALSDKESTPDRQKKSVSWQPTAPSFVSVPKTAMAAGGNGEVSQPSQDGQGEVARRNIAEAQSMRAEAGEGRPETPALIEPQKQNYTDAAPKQPEQWSVQQPQATNARSQLDTYSSGPSTAAQSSYNQRSDQATSEPGKTRAQLRYEQLLREEQWSVGRVQTLTPDYNRQQQYAQPPPTQDLSRSRSMESVVVTESGKTPAQLRYERLLKEEQWSIAKFEALKNPNYRPEQQQQQQPQQQSQQYQYQHESRYSQQYQPQQQQQQSFYSPAPSQDWSRSRSMESVAGADSQKTPAQLRYERLLREEQWSVRKLQEASNPPEQRHQQEFSQQPTQSATSWSRGPEQPQQQQHVQQPAQGSSWSRSPEQTLWSSYSASPSSGQSGYGQTSEGVRYEPIAPNQQASTYYSSGWDQRPLQPSGGQHSDASRGILVEPRSGHSAYLTSTTNDEITLNVEIISVSKSGECFDGQPAVPRDPGTQAPKKAPDEVAVDINGYFRSVEIKVTSPEIVAPPSFDFNKIDTPAGEPPASQSQFVQQENTLQQQVSTVYQDEKPAWQVDGASLQSAQFTDKATEGEFRTGTASFASAAAQEILPKQEEQVKPTEDISSRPEDNAGGFRSIEICIVQPEPEHSIPFKLDPHSSPYFQEAVNAGGLEQQVRDTTAPLASTPEAIPVTQVQPQDLNQTAAAAAAGNTSKAVDTFSDQPDTTHPIVSQPARDSKSEEQSSTSTKAKLQGATDQTVETSSAADSIDMRQGSSTTSTSSALVGVISEPEQPLQSDSKVQPTPVSEEPKPDVINESQPESAGYCRSLEIAPSDSQPEPLKETTEPTSQQDVSLALLQTEAVHPAASVIATGAPLASDITGGPPPAASEAATERDATVTLAQSEKATSSAGAESSGLVSSIAAPAERAAAAEAQALSGEAQQQVAVAVTTVAEVFDENANSNNAANLMAARRSNSDEAYSSATEDAEQPLRSDSALRAEDHHSRSASDESQLANKPDAEASQLMKETVEKPETPSEPQQQLAENVAEVQGDRQQQIDECPKIETPIETEIKSAANAGENKDPEIDLVISKNDTNEPSDGKQDEVAASSSAIESSTALEENISAKQAIDASTADAQVDEEIVEDVPFEDSIDESSAKQETSELKTLSITTSDAAIEQSANNATADNSPKALLDQQQKLEANANNAAYPTGSPTLTPDENLRESVITGFANNDIAATISSPATEAASEGNPNEKLIEETKQNEEKQDSVASPLQTEQTESSAVTTVEKPPIVLPSESLQQEEQSVSSASAAVESEDIKPQITTTKPSESVQPSPIVADKTVVDTTGFPAEERRNSIYSVSRLEDDVFGTDSPTPSLPSLPETTATPPTPVQPSGFTTAPQPQAEAPSSTKPEATASSTKIEPEAAVSQAQQLEISSATEAQSEQEMELWQKVAKEVERHHSYVLTPEEIEHMNLARQQSAQEDKGTQEPPTDGEAFEESPATAVATDEDSEKPQESAAEKKPEATEPVSTEEPQASAQSPKPDQEQEQEPASVMVVPVMEQIPVEEVQQEEAPLASESPAEPEPEPKPEVEVQPEPQPEPEPEVALEVQPETQAETENAPEEIPIPQVEEEKPVFNVPVTVEEQPAEIETVAPPSAEETQKAPTVIEEPAAATEPEPEAPAEERAPSPKLKPQPEPEIKSIPVEYVEEPAVVSPEPPKTPEVPAEPEPTRIPIEIIEEPVPEPVAIPAAPAEDVKVEEKIESPKPMSPAPESVAAEEKVTSPTPDQHEPESLQEKSRKALEDSGLAEEAAGETGQQSLSTERPPAPKWMSARAPKPRYQMRQDKKPEAEEAPSPSPTPLSDGESGEEQFPRGGSAASPETPAARHQSVTDLGELASKPSVSEPSVEEKPFPTSQEQPSGQQIKIEVEDFSKPSEPVAVEPPEVTAALDVTRPVTISTSDSGAAGGAENALDVAERIIERLTARSESALSPGDQKSPSIEPASPRKCYSAEPDLSLAAKMQAASSATTRRRRKDYSTYTDSHASNRSPLSSTAFMTYNSYEPLSKSVYLGYTRRINPERKYRRISGYYGDYTKPLNESINYFDSYVQASTLSDQLWSAERLLERSRSRSRQRDQVRQADREWSRERSRSRTRQLALMRSQRESSAPLGLGSSACFADYYQHKDEELDRSIRAQSLSRCNSGLFRSGSNLSLGSGGYADDYYAANEPIYPSLVRPCHYPPCYIIPTCCCSARRAAYLAGQQSVAACLCSNPGFPARSYGCALPPQAYLRRAEIMSGCTARGYPPGLDY